MIAYNPTSLDNMDIKEQAGQALAAGCITGEEQAKIRASCPTNLYTPNIFMCVGLFLLTVVIISFSVGMIMMIIASGGVDAFAPQLLIAGLICYGALEFVVYNKRHFRSGVDYALLWISAGLIYAGLYSLNDNMGAVSQCIIVFALALLFTLRFANNIMTVVAYAALLGFIFNIAIESGATARAILPFLVMAVSGAVYFMARALLASDTYRHYRQCLTVLKAAALLSFYLAGNYFVVRELNAYLLGSPSSGQSSGFSSQGSGSFAQGSGPSAQFPTIPLGWMFWLLTALTPLLYIFQGVRKKDPVFLWIGLVLIAATVFTIRQYYHVLPAEWAMILGGAGMIVLAYSLTRYLRTPRNGFTSMESNDKHLLQTLHIESLVIAETFAGPSTAPSGNDFQFGGGSGGGGGAGGQY